MTDDLDPKGLPPVERIEMVSYENGYREPAEPMWRVQVGEFCADFETETAANNFRQAILDRLQSEADRLKAVEARMRAAEKRALFHRNKWGVAEGKLETAREALEACVYFLDDGHTIPPNEARYRLVERARQALSTISGTGSGEGEEGSG